MRDHIVARSYAETLFEGLWVFGALFLFAAIGAGITDVSRKIELLPKLLPALACGLAGREQLTQILGA